MSLLRVFYCKFNEKTILLFILLLGLSTASFSQNDEPKSESVNLQFFYGTPNSELYTSKNFRIINNSEIVGVRGEFILNNLFSFGMEISYGTNEVVSKTPTSVIVYVDGIPNYTETYANYKYSILRYIPMIGVHFIELIKLIFH